MDAILKVAANWILPALFFWFLFSFMAMTIIELIATGFQFRQNTLKEVITLLLGDKLTEDFYTHALANPLEKTRPAYISDSIFAKVVMDWIIRRDNDEIVNTNPSLEKLMQNIQKNIVAITETAKDPDFGEVLQSIVTPAGMKTDKVSEFLDLVQKDLEAWFSEATNQMSAVYRRRIQIVTLLVGVVLAAFVNFDVINMTSQLWTASRIRDNIELAQDIGMAVPVDSALSTDLPLGWNRHNMPPALLIPWLVKAAGILFSGFLIGIGAQYAFDLLRRQIRVSQ